MFGAESYWRDVLALSWNLQTLNGAEAILNELPALARRGVAAQLVQPRILAGSVRDVLTRQVPGQVAAV